MAAGFGYYPVAFNFASRIPLLFEYNTCNKWSCIRGAIMAWLCRFLEEEPQVRYPGDMWYAPGLISGIRGQHAIEQELSEDYIYGSMATRAPLMLTLPDRSVICLDSRYVRYDMGGQRLRSGYRVYGSPPRITLLSSIETDSYHGWLRDGILSDDFEGREYE
jgi:hypothetical protein